MVICVALSTLSSALSSVDVLYLRKVMWLQFNMEAKYILCNAVGDVLQWGGANSTSIGGFTKQSLVGSSSVSTKNTTTYVITLLSLRPSVRSNTMFTSVLVLYSTFGNINDIEISCSNNIDINCTRIEDKPIYTLLQYHINTNNNVFVDYVLSAPLFSNSSLLLHIFVGGTNNRYQNIAIQGKSAVGLDGDDALGTTRTSLFIGNNLINLQVILISKQSNVTTTIIFVIEDMNFTLIYGYQSNVVHVQSRHKFILLSEVDAMATPENQMISKCSLGILLSSEC